MKKFYIAVTEKDENNRYYAYGIKVSENDNVLNRLENMNLLHANICETKKRCTELVDCWNEAYKRNGTYAFQYPLF